MASDESRRILADLHTWPASDGLPLGEWRHRAAALERAAAPQSFATEAVDAGGVPAQWVTLGPPPPDDSPVGLLFHGGGFIVCSAATHAVLGARLGRAAGTRMLVVDYRRAPEAPFPAAVEDCLAAYAWVRDHVSDRVWLFGDSAGGNLGLTVCLLAHQRRIPLPRALVLASPLTDFTFSGRSYAGNAHLDPFARIDSPARMAEYYLAGADPRDPLASPLFAREEDLDALPPTLIVLGPDEVLFDDAERLHARMSQSEMEVVDGAFHTWLGYAGTLPEADRTITRIGAYVRDWTR